MKAMEDPKGLKKLLFNPLFWLGAYVVLYFIFASIPITWDESGYGWNTWDGLNFYKTLLAYLTKICLILFVAFLILYIIRKIQKSKIGDYWKISFTILGIIGIIAYVIYSFAGTTLFDSLSPKDDERIGDLDNYNKIKTHIEFLEEDGYEVIYFSYLDVLNDTSTHTAYLKMKSLGERKKQIWAGLFALNDVYPNAPQYTLRIIEPTKECWYRINNTYYGAYKRASAGERVYYTDGTEADALTLYSYINSQIEEDTKLCS
jgi:hypothetical protein